MNTLRQQWLSYMNDPARRSLASGDGGCYLPDLGVVEFTGSDASDFLQGYLTCDTETLRPNALQPWALCNLKGRVIANGWCAPRGSDGVVLITHRSLTTVLAEFFKPYLMFAKTQLTLHGDEVLVFGSLTSTSPDALAISDGLQLTLVWDLPAAARIYQPNSQVGDWEARLLQAGLCLVTDRTSAAFLPQMLGLDATGAVSFDKGCYLGQEVVARAQHRGSVKRRLQQLHWQGVEPQPGAALTTGAGRKVGTVINATATGFALAVIASETDFPLHTESSTASDKNIEPRDTVLTQTP